MKRTIDLDEQSELLLDQWAKAMGTSSEEETLRELTTAVLRFDPLRVFLSAHSGSEKSALISRFIDLLLAGENLEPVRSTAMVMGGDHCIRNTRIPIWLLASYKRQGLTDSALLANYPGLNTVDLTAAWDFYAANPEIVERERRRHEEAA